MQLFAQKLADFEKYCVSLQRERNLFRMGAPFGTASDPLK